MSSWDMCAETMHMSRSGQAPSAVQADFRQGRVWPRKSYRAFSMTTSGNPWMVGTPGNGLGPAEPWQLAHSWVEGGAPSARTKKGSKRAVARINV